MQSLLSLRAVLRAPFAPASQVSVTRTFASSSLLSAKKRIRRTDVSLKAEFKGTRKAEQPLISHKPITPGTRHLKRVNNPHLYRGKPVKVLTIAKRKTGGRNQSGRVTTRHIGGGHKQRIRTVDFYRSEPGSQSVVRIEYDPGRSGHIALVMHSNQSARIPMSYVLAPEGVRAGDSIQSFRRGIPDGLVAGYTDKFWLDRSPEAQEALDRISSDAAAAAAHQRSLQMSSASSSSDQSLFQSSSHRSNEEQKEPEDDTRSLSIGILRQTVVKVGNVLPLRIVPPGTFIHNISLRPDGPAKLVRSAGAYATVITQDDLEQGGRYTQIRLQSGEIRHVLNSCCATVGRVSNIHWQFRSLAKAGRARNLGRRPSVRGVAMNAVDHGHGGGRGKSKGNKHPVSVYGWKTKGTRTRRPGNKGNRFVVTQRPRGKDKKKQ